MENWLFHRVLFNFSVPSAAEEEQDETSVEYQEIDLASEVHEETSNPEILSADALNYKQTVQLKTQDEAART